MYPFYVYYNVFNCKSYACNTPVGFAYSTYSGLTVAGVVLFTILKFNKVPNLYGMIGIVFIIIGVVMVNYLGRLN